MDHALNWLWQGTVVAAAAWVVLRLLARSRARFRYALCWIVLVIVLALPVIPLVSSDLSSSFAPAAGPAVSTEVLLAVPDTWWASANAALSLWAFWFAACGVRITAALVTLRRVRRRCRPFPWMVESRLECWNRVRLSGRATRIVLSDDVRAAAILGCGSPVIAVTPALIAHLQDGELDRVVIHEWTHVQRRDDLLNVAQFATWAFAGWHPAVWWLSRQLQIEREAACDEMTIALTGSAKSYAASLAKTATLTPDHRPVFALEVLSAPGLRTRVVRILGYGRLVSKTRSVSASMTGAASVAGLALCVAGLRLIGPAALAAPFEPADSSATAVIDRAPGPVATARPSTPEKRPASRSTRKPGRESQPASMTPSAAAETRDSEIGERPPVTSLIPTIPVATAHGLPAVNTVALGAPPSSPAPAVADAKTPWGAAAESGISVGRASQKAAVATAGFFARLGRKIAGSF